MPIESAIRDLLPSPGALRTMTHAQKKVAAEKGLQAILLGIREGHITLGDWEKISIENAVLMIDRGLYTAANNEIACAIWPARDRSPKLNISAQTASRTLEEFERELERLMRNTRSGREHAVES